MHSLLSFLQENTNFLSELDILTGVKYPSFELTTAFEHSPPAVTIWMKSMKFGQVGSFYQRYTAVFFKGIYTIEYQL